MNRPLRHCLAPFTEYTSSGPYKDKLDGRQRIHLNKSGKPALTMLYARYLYSVSIGSMLPDDLSVDHIDGNKFNDTVENLQSMPIGDNIRKHIKNNRGQKAESLLPCKEIWENWSGAECVKKIKIIEIRKNCKECERSFHSREKDQVFCSKSCRAVNQNKTATKVNHDRLKETLDKVTSRKISWLEAGRILGVSDNSVRKWARKLGYIK